MRRSVVLQLVPSRYLSLSTGERTSWFFCNASTRSCDTELGPELFPIVSTL